MLKKEVKIGGFYAIRHHTDSATRLSVIRIDSESQYGGWNATKLSTGRSIRIKSAAKLRYEVVRSPEDYRAIYRGKWMTVAKARELGIL
jgi:hypothetical protein